MKFTVEQKIFKEAINWVSSSLAVRPPIPVLAGILLEVENSVLKISSFDYEVSSRIEIPIENSSHGISLVSGRLLDQIINALPSADVNVELQETHVLISCKNSKFNLATMPVREYPQLPQLPPVSGTIDAGILKDAVSQVSIAASKDETFPMLTSVRMEADRNEMTLLATDRYRLAVKKIQWEGQSDIAGVQIKAKTLSEIAKSLHSNGKLDIDVSENNDLIGFQSQAAHATSLVVDGQYPDTKKLFPKESPTIAVAKTSELMEAIRRVALVVEGHASIQMNFSSESISLAGGTTENAGAKEALSAQLTGEDITTAYNPIYLNEGLNALKTPYVRFSFTDGSKPVVITGQEKQDGDDIPDYRYLLMPVRL